MKDEKLIAAILGAITAYIQMEQQTSANDSQDQAQTAG
jgi:hypothetical protein